MRAGFTNVRSVPDVVGNGVIALKYAGSNTTIVQRPPEDTRKIEDWEARSALPPGGGTWEDFLTGLGVIIEETTTTTTTEETTTTTTTEETTTTTTTEETTTTTTTEETTTTTTTEETTTTTTTEEPTTTTTTTNPP